MRILAFERREDRSYRAVAWCARRTVPAGVGDLARTVEQAFVSLGVWFLRQRDTDQAQAWWAAVAELPHAAPGIIRELLRDPSVVCDRTEALQALSWAKAHPAWRDDEPPLEAVDSLRERAN